MSVSQPKAGNEWVEQIEWPQIVRSEVGHHVHHLPQRRRWRDSSRLRGDWTL